MVVQVGNVVFILAGNLPGGYSGRVSICWSGVMSCANQAGLSPRVRGLLCGLAVLGLALPWGCYVYDFSQGGSLALFWLKASANPVATAITLDVYLAALAFSVWVLAERRSRRPWAWVALCFAVGLACALPWYVATRAPQRG